MTKKPTDEARIQAMIASDTDAPEPNDAQLDAVKPFAEAFPALAEKMRRNPGGRLKVANPKVALSLRLNPEIVERFKADDPGWQTRIDDALREAVGLK